MMGDVGRGDLNTCSAGGGELSTALIKDGNKLKFESLQTIA